MSCPKVTEAIEALSCICSDAPTLLTQDSMAAKKTTGLAKVG